MCVYEWVLVSLSVRVQVDICVSVRVCVPSNLFRCTLIRESECVCVSCVRVAFIKMRKLNLFCNRSFTVTQIVIVQTGATEPCTQNSNGRNRAQTHNLQKGATEP